MSDRTQCPECAASIRKDPTRCAKCGWVAPIIPPTARSQLSACSVSMCAAPGIARYWTAEGWQNACRGHMADVKAREIARNESSDFAKSVRESYERSQHRRALASGATVDGHVGASIPRIPGEDDK